MIRTAAAFLAIAVIPAAPACAAQLPASVVITAQQIALHSDRSLLVASGGVSVRWESMQIAATRVQYELRTNRLLAAGDVTVSAGSGQLNATGYVYDFTAKRGAVVAGAIVPELSTSDATALGQQVELRPTSTITFTNAQVLAGSTLTPVASYTYYIPAPNAKDFGYSPVPSAALEWPVLIGSSRNAYEFARLRYDRYNAGPGAGLEEHYARTDRGYVVLGQTLDADASRYDLAAYERLNANLSQSLTGSYLPGAHAARYALTSSGRRGYSSLSFSQYNASRSDDLLFSGNQRAMGRAASLRLQIDLGHDIHPGDWNVVQDFRLTPGMHVDTAALRIGASSITGSCDLGESLYSYGRATLSSDASLWGNFPVTAKLLFTAGAGFSHDAPPFPSTYRTYTWGATWRASQAFNLVTSIAYAHDYGQAAGFGRPQYSAAFDVRVRRKNGSGIEVGALVPFGGVGNMGRQAGLNLRFIRQ